MLCNFLSQSGSDLQSLHGQLRPGFQWPQDYSLNPMLKMCYKDRPNYLLCTHYDNIKQFFSSLWCLSSKWVARDMKTAGPCSSKPGGFLEACLTWSRWTVPHLKQISTRGWNLVKHSVVQKTNPNQNKQRKLNLHWSTYSILNIRKNI